MNASLIKTSGESAMTNTAENALVSVIVPIYNAGIRLVDALVSVQEQTHANLEAICVDDGSTDASAAIMDLFASEDERFRIVRKANAGYGAAMNDGLAAARGTWVAILEPDDWMDADMLEEMLSFAAAFTEAPDVVKCPYWWVTEGDEFGQARLNCTYKGLVHPSTQPFGLEEAPELFAHHPSIWSALYRKDYLDEKDIRFPEYPGSGWADNRFLAETLLKTKRIAYLDRPFYNYRATSREGEDAFAKRAPLLPLERWLEMADVMDGLHLTDERIWRAHIRRGFTYLAQVEGADALDAAGVRDAIARMFSRMDERIVLSDAAISPAHRRMYAQALGIECIKPNHATYASHLAREAFRRARVNGVKATLADAKRFLGA